MMMKIAIAASLLFLVYTFFRGGLGTVSSADAKKLVAEGAKLIDVRSPEEFRGGHINGAMNIPVQNLESRLVEIGAKDAPIVVYCLSGARSARAQRMLKAAGYANVHNLGAMSRW